MATATVTELDVLREVARTVIGKAKHHAPGLEHLVLTLTGAVAAYRDPGSVRAGLREGHQITSCWFELSGVSYFLSFDKDEGRIRHGGKQGPIDLAFSDATTGQDIVSWFETKSAIPAVG
jgi:Integron cassette protein VCH_CASS1 chain